jgi:hypothetical protein
MNRKAILIGSPNGPDPALPGVDVDLKDLTTYLQSIKGGAWDSSEISLLRNPSKKEVRSMLDTASHFDYVLITCSGHGDHHVRNDFDDTSFCINKAEEIYISEINPRNKRQLIVVDVCRKVVLLKAEESRMFAAHEAAIYKFDEDRKNARKMFDQAVLSCAEGRIVVYSCDKNQTAGDPGSGGIFTQSLIKIGESYVKKPSGVMDINDAFQLAKARTYQLNAPQTPTINAGRRRDYYPFAVSV